MQEYESKEETGEVKAINRISNPNYYLIKVGTTLVEACLNPKSKLCVHLGYIVRIQRMQSDTMHGIITGVVRKV